MKEANWKKYLFVLLVTIIIFSTTVFISNYFNNKRVDEINSIENKLSMDLLSSETQFVLLSESSCKDFGGTSGLSGEINSLSEKLSYAESNLGVNDKKVVELKKYYSLLEIKDYILMQRLSQKCGVKPIVILYFYSNAGDCKLCEKTGYVLTYLRENYPQVRVYSFDYNLNLSAIKTMIGIFNVRSQLPAIVVNDETNYNVYALDDFETLIPELKKLESEKQNDIVATTSKKITPRFGNNRLVQ